MDDVEKELKRPDKEAYLQKIRAKKTEEPEPVQDVDTPDTEGITPQDDPTPTPEPTQEKNWQSEYEKLQARFDEQRAYHDRHYNQIQNKLQKREKVLSKFENFLVKDESGDPVDWDFGKPKPNELSPDILQKDPAEFISHLTKSVESSIERQLSARLKAEREVAQMELQKKEWSRIADESYNQALTEFPDLKDQTSDLFKRAVSILQSDTILQQNPKGDYYAALLAAKELGRIPIKRQPNNGKKMNLNQQSASIVQGPSGGRQDSGSSGRFTSEDLMAMLPEERIATMKRAYLESVRGG